MRLLEFSSRGGRDDRGASAILVAASLVLLMGMAAIAVDAGLGYNDRRQQAAAADVGALAAVQFAKTTLTTSHPDCTGLSGKPRAACRGAEEAIAVVDGTLPGRYTDPDWENCTDPNRPVEYSILSAISPQCITFTSDLRRARVMLPGTDVETAFAKVLGFGSIHVSAFAEAGLEQTISGGVLPFALGPSGAGSNQACFFTQDNPTLDIDPCNGSAEGNFGKLDVRWYGNELYGEPDPVCNGQNAWRMAINIITGTDHPLEIYTDSPGTVNDVTNCDIITQPVDEIDTWTGNAAGAIADGFFNGVTAPTYEGRLSCKDGDAAEDYPAFNYVSTGTLDPCVGVNPSHQPETVDHTPLWEFLDWSNGPCNASINDRAEMEACIAHYKTVSPGVPLFTTDLVESPRFGGVPELLTDPGGGTGSYLITGFTPVYLETIYYKCDGPTKCAIVHSPGEDSDASPPASCPDPITATTTSCGWPVNGLRNIEALTAFILTLDMLPGDVSADFPYQPGTLVFNLWR